MLGNSGGPTEGGRSLSEPPPTPEYPNCLRPSFSRSFPISRPPCAFSHPHLGDWQRELSQERRRERKKERKKDNSSPRESALDIGEHSRYSRCVNRTGVRALYWIALEIRTVDSAHSNVCTTWTAMDRRVVSNAHTPNEKLESLRARFYIQKLI